MSDPSRYVPLSTRGERVCACGRRFTCDLEAGKPRCWCADFPKVLPVPAADAACLCPECLARAIARAQDGA